jgi:hypothetical protein
LILDAVTAKPDITLAELRELWQRRGVSAAGPYGSARVGTTSLERARSAPHAPGSPDPASPTLRHTCPSTPSHPRRPRARPAYAVASGTR